jgi:hypothetical protein
MEAPLMRGRLLGSLLAPTRGGQKFSSKARK